MSVFETSLDSLGNLIVQAGNVAPRLLLAIGLLLLGWLIAFLLRRVSIKLLRLARVEDLAEKTGLESFLLKGGVRFTTTTLIAATVYWSIIFIALFVALEVLDVDVAHKLLERVVLYLPNIFVATVVLIFGSLIAKFAGALVEAYLNNVGIESAEVMSTIAQVAVLLFFVFVALEQLAVGTTILSYAFLIAFGGLTLALGLAFGLGGQDVAKRILEKIYKKLSE